MKQSGKKIEIQEKLITFRLLKTRVLFFIVGGRGGDEFRKIEIS